MIDWLLKDVHKELNACNSMKNEIKKEKEK